MEYIIMKSLNTETIKYFIGGKFYFFKAAELLVYVRRLKENKEMNGIK